eukprot:943235-Amorphochlora_amoeboformis.AAC.2
MHPTRDAFNSRTLPNVSTHAPYRMHAIHIRNFTIQLASSPDQGELADLSQECSDDSNYRLLTRQLAFPN